MWDQDRLNELIELTRQPVRDIRHEGTVTVIEFADGRILPLYGGGQPLYGVVSYRCSFCGREHTAETPLVSLTGHDHPLICVQCAVAAVRLFIQHGVEVEIDVPNVTLRSFGESAVSDGE